MIDYQEFKNACREVNPSLTNSRMKAAYKILFMFGPYNIADTNVCQTNQEMDKTMYIEDMCVPCAPAPKGFCKAKTIVANAQIIGAAPVEATQRDYAIELIKAIGEKHAKALRKQFHLDSDRPKTALELIDAIKNDKYTLNQDILKSQADEIAKGYFNNEYGINWGPEADAVGYLNAMEALKAADQKALTQVTLKPIDALEGVIEDFEGWTA